MRPQPLRPPGVGALNPNRHPDVMPDRTYTEQEVAVLLERAAELQAQTTRRGEDAPGLTLTELETVAAEAGLDPLLLRQAAAEFDEPRRPLLDRETGTTATHVSVERRVPGTLTPEAWEDVVAELRHRFDTDLGKMWGMPGYGQSATEQIGRTSEWKHTSLSGIETRVLIRPRGERLHVRASQRVGWGSPLAEASTYSLLLAGLAALVTGTLASSGAAGMVALVFALLVSVPVILTADRAWRRKKHRELDELADYVAALVAGPPEAGEAEDVRGEQILPRLDPSLLEDKAPGRQAAPRRTRSA